MMIAVRLTIKQRWWLSIYIAALSAFITSIAWALDEDDERLDAFLDRQGEFIANHGFKVVTSGEDRGN